LIMDGLMSFHQYENLDLKIIGQLSTHNYQLPKK